MTNHPTIPIESLSRVAGYLDALVDYPGELEDKKVRKVAQDALDIIFPYLND